MTRREDGRWQQSMTVTENGTTRQKYFYGRSKREVLDKIAAWQKQQTNGERFRTIAELWWEEHEPTLTVNSVKNYKPAYERAKARFGDSFIRQITPSDVNRFIRDFVKKYEAADKTARTQLMVVNQIFRYAVANGYVGMNVARDISVPKGQIGRAHV
jgi:site-specific recombinase XerD